MKNRKILMMACLIFVVTLFGCTEGNKNDVEASYKAYKVVSKQELDNMVIYQLQHKKTGCYWTLTKYYDNSVSMQQMFVQSANYNVSVPYCSKPKYGED